MEEVEQPKTLYEKTKSILRRFWFVINIVLVFFLLLSYLAIYVSPVKCWYLAILGLAFPYLALLNILFLFSWLLRGRKHVMLSLIALIIGWNHHVAVLQIPIGKVFGFKPSKEELAEPKIKIVSYNVRSFNFFEWNKNKAAREQIMDFIYSEKPDIICFQEYFIELEGKKKKKLFNPEVILKKWPYHYASLKPAPNGKFGIAVFSRYPIINKGDFKFKESDNLTIFVDLKINKDTIRLYNNHLQSYRFDKNDYALVDSFNVAGGHSKQVSGVMRIGSRLKRAFIQRSMQTDTVASHAAKSPYPIIICGDFNDTPNSYTYQQMKGNCKDAFIEAGWGISNTYAGNFPSFRIDYILHSASYKAISYHSPRVTYSDHYPVTSVLIKKKNQ